MWYAVYQKFGGNNMRLVSDITKDRPKLNGMQNCVLLSGENSTSFDEYLTLKRASLRDAKLVIVENRMPDYLWLRRRG